jgi:hypothetical protein
VIAASVTAASGAATVINTSARVDRKVVAPNESYASICEDRNLLVLKLVESQAEIDQTKRKADRQESHAEKWKDTVGAARIECNAALNCAKAAEAELASLRATVAETIACRESELKAAWVKVRVSTFNPFVIEGLFGHVQKSVKSWSLHHLW